MKDDQLAAAPVKSREVRLIGIDNRSQSLNGTCSVSDNINLHRIEVGILDHLSGRTQPNFRRAADPVAPQSTKAVFPIASGKRK